RVALFLVRHGEVALVEADGALLLPTARGSGEGLAREFLAEMFADADPEADLELVGFAPSRRSGTDLEVWLHECTHDVECAQPVLWIPLDELMERVGAPRLRDPLLSSMLLLLARSEIGMRLLRECPAERAAPVVIPALPHRVGVKWGDDPEDFLDAELSVLDFNQRVLELAEDPAVPLLERFRFLSIFSGNLDEFFVVRVARLKTEAAKALEADDAALSGSDLLDLVAIRVRALVTRQYRCLIQSLLPALAAKGVRVRRWDELDDGQRAELGERFQRDIFPLLTPRAVSAAPGHPFPRLRSLGLSLAVLLRAPGQSEGRVAHVPIPSDLPRFLPVAGGDDLVALEEVVIANSAPLFPAYEVLETHLFRVSRMSDVDIDENASESLLAAAEDEVDARPYKPVVRIEVQRTMPRFVRAQLLRELRSERGTESSVLSRADIFEVDGPVDLRGFSEIAALPVADELFPAFAPRIPLPSVQPVFDVLRERDVLVHHPYDSFDDTVGRFLREAARDPAVVSIRLTLYRTGRDSPVMEALLDALHGGKEVSVFVELKARFDEESNISWTHRLAEAGAHVVYGLVGFKTHAKTALVIRREETGVRRYVHIGTGNYNASTARLYTDLGLMSADADLGADLNDFFNELTGSAGPPSKDYRRLWVAPHSLARELLRAIDREIEHARAGRPARIQAKMNGLTDRKLIKTLYQASSAGVEIDLVVRALCTLRPGVRGLSECIRVRSILGRFLEHARIFYFENAGQSEYYIGSA
ncbi:MAG TPA: polyphosphate kinase 1, partial [Longimicrobiales bacterium]|nr:polyphosphate kinase 1 [Longimicrobiales bacterium]